MFEFEAAARKVLPPAHWGYMASGVDNDESLQANLQGFSHYQVRARRLVDVSRIDMSTQIFGTTWETPIVLCPIGSSKIAEPGGELTVAKAAPRRKLFRSFRRRRRTRSKRSPARAALRSGFSSTPPINGKPPRRC